ncbi:pancreatic lipase-related protein 2-like, partial [Agrilus planipennis]|uniref:Pancreatic lipase-related protein 2-like n=1 Tax=Agrilus planipennis TaxID=224129 RepID=A0A1W4WTI5_AGRPL
MNKLVALILLLQNSSSVSDNLQANQNNNITRPTSNRISGPLRKSPLENFQMRYVLDSDFHFTFYNKDHPKGIEMLKDEHYKNILPQVFPDKPVRFITHGWKASCKAGFCTELRDEYLKNEDNQVIIAEWESLSNEIEYFEIVEQTGEFAVIFSKALTPVVEKVHGENVQIIALGVGAHLCGIAAELITNTTKMKIGRITGLDPSWRSFEIPIYGLQKSQATFVDIIHTTAGSSGIPEPRGHVDFYPNGGIVPQPGCRRRFMRFALDKCSHNLSWGWFKNTINSQPKNYKMGYRCTSGKILNIFYCNFNDVTPFGQMTPASARGVYYLEIKKWPFPSNRKEFNKNETKKIEVQSRIKELRFFLCL